MDIYLYGKIYNEFTEFVAAKSLFFVVYANLIVDL